MDGMLHVLSLLNIAELANAINPETYCTAGIAPQYRKVIIHMRLRARMLLAWLNSRYEVWRNGATTNLTGFAEDFLLHQMDVMSIRKELYDGHSAKPLDPNFTVETLHRELRDCRQQFSQKPWLPQDGLPSLLLPRCHIYKILEKDIISDMPADISGELFSDKEWQQGRNLHS
jgi:hypothetical protein